jgi:anti-anti-sigma factor
VAKYRHRVFEMYEYRVEAMRALSPKYEEIGEEESGTTLQSDFKHLIVTCSTVVTHVQFSGEMEFTDESEQELQEDFSKLVDTLGIASKVLLDFTDVKSFSPACINVLVVLERKLRNRGSRIVLCSLSPETRAAFFGPR